MYYRLGRKLRLRGWTNLSSVLVDDCYQIVKVLNKKEFGLLMMCDGVTHMDEIVSNEDNACILNKYINDDMVIVMDKPQPILDEQKYRSYKNRYFESIQWSITGKCNYHCRHCYMDAPESRLGELPFSEMTSIVDQVSECGIKVFDLTGGEPFVRKDFWDLVDYIRSKGMIVRKIYTNGWLLTENMLQKFADRNMNTQFSLSFDGLGWHDWMRCVSGAEKRAIEALKMCHEARIRTDVEMCLHKGNLSVVRDTINFLDSIGVDALKIGSVSNTPLWLKNSEGNSITLKESYDAALEYLPHYYEDGMPMHMLWGGAYSLQRHTTEYAIVSEKADSEKKCMNMYLCGAARFNAYITPDGRFLPCMAITSSDAQYKFPLIKDIGMKQCMSDSYYMNFVGNHVRDLYARNKKCGECPYRFKCCGGCRAIAMLANDGDLYASDPEACFLFENGYPDKFHAAADAAIAKYCGGQSRA